MTFLLQYAASVTRGIDYRMMNTWGWADIDAYDTVTEGIYYCLHNLCLDQADLLITLDDQGRVINAGGTVKVTMNMRSGMAHELKVEFSIAAHDFGTTVLPSVEVVVGK